MLDLKLDSNNDLDVSGHGLTLIDGAQRVGQQIGVVLRGFLGEWEFDLDWGTDWFGRVLGIKPVNLNDAEGALRSKILGVDGAKSILSLSMDFDRALRKWSLRGLVDTEFGEVQVEGQFP